MIARPDEQFKPLEIRLRKMDPRDLLTVSGRLLDARGKPVAGADVRLLTIVPRLVPDAPSFIKWNEIKYGAFERTFPCQEFLVGVTDNRGSLPSRRCAAGYGELAYWKQGLDPAREVLPLAGPAPRLVKLTLKARDPRDSSWKPTPKSGRTEGS